MKISRILAVTMGALLAGCAAAPPVRSVAVDALLPGATTARSRDGGRAMPSVLAAVAAEARGQATFVARQMASQFVDELHGEMLAATFGDPRDPALVAALAPGDATAWTAWVRDRLEHPELHQRLAAARASIAMAWQRGDTATALATARSAAAQAPPGLAAGVAGAWHAFAAAAAGESAAAVAMFAAAANELATPSPVLAAQVALLAHTIHADAALWTAAVTRLAAAMTASPGLATPRLWQRAVSTRPQGVQWPTAVLSACGALLGSDAAAFGPDAGDNLVLEALATMHLQRGEPLAALVAFRQVDEASAPLAVRGLAQVGQAKALVTLGRSGDARAVLVATIALHDPVACCAGLAQLGAIELAEERPAVAGELLQKALAPAAVCWSDRPGAVANLAIVQQLRGESSSAATFARAQQAFLVAGDANGLLLCLENEVALRPVSETVDTQRQLEMVRMHGIQALRVEGLEPRR